MGVSWVFGPELMIVGKERAWGRELGMTCTAVANRLGIGQPAVSLALSRGEGIVKERDLRLSERFGSFVMM